MNSYTMDRGVAITNQGSSELCNRIKHMNVTRQLVDVQKVKYFQEQDIDYIWHYWHYKKMVRKFLEFKVDTYHKSGNFFFETVSNQGKNTQGCFLYSKADYWFYYFIDTKELNIIPLAEAQKWFSENQYQFRECEVKTPFKNGVGFYKSKGRIVPKDIVREAVPGMKTIILTEYLKMTG